MLFRSDSDTETLYSTARKHLCQLSTLRWQQKDGLDTVLPYGLRKIQALRTLTNVFSGSCEQLSLFSPPAVDNLIGQGVPPRAAVRMVREEAVQCLANAL